MNDGATFSMSARMVVTDGMVTMFWSSNVNVYVIPVARLSSFANVGMIDPNGYTVTWLLFLAKQSEQ
jgi:hypothetical protein